MSLRSEPTAGIGLPSKTHVGASTCPLIGQGSLQLSDEEIVSASEWRLTSSATVAGGQRLRALILSAADNAAGRRQGSGARFTLGVVNLCQYFSSAASRSR
jgi:hypothetical protein